MWKRMWTLFVSSIVAVWTLVGCGDDEEMLVETGAQMLTVDCVEGSGEFGTLEYAAVQITYNDRNEQVVLALAPRGGPAPLECLTVDPDGIPDNGDERVEMAPIRLGPVVGLPRGDALISAVFFGKGPCDAGPDGIAGNDDDRTYSVLTPVVRNCDLRQPPPIDCGLQSEILTCIDL